MAKNNKSRKEPYSKDFTLVHYNCRFGLYQYVQIMTMSQAVMLDYLTCAKDLLEERHERFKEYFSDNGEFYKTDDWFMCPSEVVRRDLRITTGQEQRLLSYLRKKKLIKTRRFGMPGVRYTKIMWENIRKLLKTD